MNVKMGANARMSWDQITDQPSIPTVPSFIKATYIDSVSIQSPNIYGGTVAIGSYNNVFKADSNGVYLGNGTFANAPFKVSMDGKLTALDGTFTGSIIGSTITGSTIKTAASNEGYLELSGNGLVSKNNINEKNGVAIDSGNFSSIDFYYRNEYRGGLAQTAGNLALTTTMGPIIIEAAQASSTMFRGKVDFTYATVTGIVAKFG
ncbi:hypothetical protein [Paenibacillus sp. FSL H8-0332]|uniref:hypothetical protein n=1 Tax=Paenibacillus sp. FSL H8-0332 TaxID=2954742 RepID=UPI0030CCEB29